MSEVAFSAVALKGLLAWASLWFLLFVCWRPYRVDAFRQSLFNLRHELFMYAAQGEITFDDKAYRELRRRINGMLRFAHRVNFLRLSFSVLLNSISPNPLLTGPSEKWRKCLQNVPSGHVRDKLTNIHYRMGVLMVRHMLTGSLTLLLSLGIYVLALMIRRSVQRILEFITSTVPGLLHGLELLESEALEC